MDTLGTLIFVAPAMLVAVILHEVAHGWVAHRCGDDTAANAGRLTLNPIAHIDPFGTIILPLLLAAMNAPLFGWAKPVPVNFRHLRNPRRDGVLVALAGPMTNVVLAILSAVLIHLMAGTADSPHRSTPPLIIFAIISVQINVMLAVLNMTPILPLDGGRVLAGLLPPERAMAFARLEPYGMLIVMGLLFTGMLSRVLNPVTDFMIRSLL